MREKMKDDLTREIIAGFYNVYGELGYGFLEKVYQNALEIEFRELGLKYERERKLVAKYSGQTVGNYRADFIVENKVIVEVKAGAELHVGARFQTLNYLRLAGLKVGLVLYFGPGPVVRRVVSDNWED